MGSTHINDHYARPPSIGLTSWIYQHAHRAQTKYPPEATRAEHNLRRLQIWKSYPEILAVVCEKNHEYSCMLIIVYSKIILNQSKTYLYSQRKGHVDAIFFHHFHPVSKVIYVIYMWYTIQAINVNVYNIFISLSIDEIIVFWWIESIYNGFYKFYLYTV